MWLVRGIFCANLTSVHGLWTGILGGSVAVAQGDPLG